jgi:Mrp family chromosome partitioning ATPase
LSEKREGKVRKFAIMNRKGVVGKTTSVVHLAAGLSLEEMRERMAAIVPKERKGKRAKA